MSQTTALLDADLTPYLDDVGGQGDAGSSRPIQWLSDAAVTLVMVLLAPILIIPVSIAFAIACVRMQHLDWGTGPERAIDRYRSLQERTALNQFRQNHLASIACSNPIPRRSGSYRWN